MADLIYQVVTALVASAITTRRYVIERVEAVLGFVKIILPGGIVNDVKMAPMATLPSSNVRVSDGIEFLDIVCLHTVYNSKLGCSRVHYSNYPRLP